MDTAALESRATKLIGECEIAAELIRKCVDENAHISVDSKVYAEKYEDLAERYTTAKEQLDAINEEITKRNIRKEQIEFFLTTLEKKGQLVTEFDTGLWNTVIDSVMVYSRARVVFRFKGGAEIEWTVI